jgi:LacI family transcriptional regulator
VTGRPQMRDVARRAGVGASSVSRVLSGHPDVSERMRETVMAAVEELGYRPDLLAQSLRSGRTYSVGFVVSDIANPMLAQVATAAERRLREAGYSLLLTNSEGRAEHDASRIRLLEQRSVDGLLLSVANENHPETIRALQEAECPVVLLDREIPLGEGLSRVTFDHRAGMAAATRSLLDLGHREIALVIGGPRRPAHERRAGVEEALAERGGANLTVIEGDFTIAHGAAAAARLGAAEPRPTAVIAAGNLLMQGVLLGLREHRLRIPDDVSFVGCDDTAVAALHEPSISVVGRDMGALGAEAAELLISQLNGDDDAREIVLPTEFIRRQSCRQIDSFSK